MLCSSLPFIALFFAGADGERRRPAPFFIGRPAVTFFSWIGGLLRVQYHLEAFLAAATTCARKVSMPFYAPQSRPQQAEALLAAFLQTDDLEAVRKQITGNTMLLRYFAGI